MHPNYSKKPLTHEEALKRVNAFHLAQLMSPADVSKATASYPERIKNRLSGRWSLCGDVSEPMFRQLSASFRPKVPLRLTAFNSSSNAAYGVLTHQVAHHQHRFVFLLADIEVHTWLESMSKDVLSFMLGNNGGGEALVIDSHLQAVDFLPLLSIGRNASQESLPTSLMALPFVLAELSKPNAIPSLLTGRHVEDISLSLLLPITI